MKRIVIDVREACRPKRAGKAQWTYGFVMQLLQSGCKLKLLTDTSVPQEWKQFGAEELVIPGAGFLWHWRAARFLKSEPGPFVYISPTSYIVPALVGKKVSTIPIVHDLIAFRSEPHHLRATVIERLTLRRATSHAVHICTMSEQTKEDLLLRFPFLHSSSISVIFAGPMHESVAPQKPDGKTILCIATLCPRKNQKRLIEAYASLPPHLRQQYRLVLAGARGWKDDDIVSLAKQTQGVEWLDFVDEQTYGQLLDTCTVFALPSLYEGFGMQILDALQRGSAILTSDRGSLKEVAGDAAVIVDPENVSSISEGLRRLLEDANFRSALSEKGKARAAQFSWKKTVELFLKAIENL